MGTRAALAFYEMLQALMLMKARQPVLNAALITLVHRLKSDSAINNELVIRNIVNSLEGGEVSENTEADEGIALPASKTMRILRELDNLKDVVYAMPYDIEILDPHWFKATQKTLFKAEAPTLYAQTLDENNEADFNLYKGLLDDLQARGLVRVGADDVAHTRLGSIVNFQNVFKYVDRTYPGYFRNNEDNVSHSSENRRFRRGDSYKHLHVRRTLRRLVRKHKAPEWAAKEDLRIRKAVPQRKCLIVLAVDHSWSMGRSRKLQYAKDSAAGLVFAAGKSGDKVALVVFSDKALVLQPPTSRIDRPMEKLTGLRPESETNIADALKKTSSVFSKAGGSVTKHAILITDGIPTSLRPDATCSGLKEEVLHYVERMISAGITVSVVCIRDELEESDDSLARRIASKGKGQFNLVRARDLLDQILREYANLKAEERIYWR